METELAMKTLTLVPLEDVVVFPNMNLTLTVDVGDAEQVLLVPRHEAEFAKVGTVADVVDRVRLPGGARAVELFGLHRGVAGAAQSGLTGELRGEAGRGGGGRGAGRGEGAARRGPGRRPPPGVSSASTARSWRSCSSSEAT